MAIKIHRGDAIAEAQVWRATPGNVEIGDTFRLSINGKLGVTFTATAATVANVTAGLTAAWNASVVAEFAEITATDAGTHVTLTADSAGTPFLVTASTVDGSGGEVSIVETTPGAEPVNEVQRIDLVGNYSGGTFTLTVDLGSGDETTGNIAYNASAATVQAAIEALTSVSAGDVAVTGGPGPSTPWFVTWKGTYAATEVAEFTIDGTNLTGNGGVSVTTTTQGGGLSDEVQFLTIKNDNTSPSGTYTLTLGGQTTGAINYNATAATVQTALEALSSIGSGNVLVYGGDQANSPGSYDNYVALLVVFTGALAATNVGAITANSSALNGSVDIRTMTQGGLSARDEIQLINLGNPTGGTFNLSFGGQTTDDITYNSEATAVFIQTKLQALSTIGSSNVEVWAIAAPEGGNWFAVKFQNTLGDSDVGELSVGEGSLTGQSGSATVTTIHSGGGSSDEVQTVTIHGTGGTFTLSDGTDTTSAIAYNAAAATVKSRIETDFSAITTVTVTGTGAVGDPFVVTFTSPTNTNLSEMTGDGTSLTGGGGTCVEQTAHSAGTDEVQTVTVTATGGTFTLSFGGQSTGNIAEDASAATVETALEALSTIDGVSVSGSDGGPWTVTFDTGNVAKTDVELMTGDETNLTGGTGSESLTITEITRSEGPNHFDSARNWSGNRVPDSGDTIYLEDGNIDLLYGLRQRTAFTVDAGTDVLTFSSDQVAFVDDQILRVKSSDTLPAGLSADTDYYVIDLDHHAGTCKLSTSSGGSAVNITDTGTGTHTIALELEGIKHIMRSSGDGGLPKRTTTDYYEYRPDYLEIGIRPGGNKEVLLGVGDGSGSQLLKIDTGDYQTEFTIHESGGSREPGLPAVRIKNDNSSTNVQVLGGEVGIAIHAGETSDINKITQRGGQIDIGNESGTVSLGELDKTSGSINARNITFSGNLSA